MTATVNLKAWIPALAQEIHGKAWSPNHDFITHLQAQQQAKELGIKWGAEMSAEDVRTLENAVRTIHGKATK